MSKRQRRLWMIAGVFIVTLAAPRPGSAGIGEWIWEMSGPSMFGVGLECKYSLQSGGVGLERCYLVGAKVGPQRDVAGPRLRLSFETGTYFSLGRNVNGEDYQLGRIWMATFDPMLEIVTHESGSTAIYHGFMGLSYNLFFGAGIEPFTNVAFKLRPIGIKFSRFAIEYNIRVYPNGFTPDEFGKLPVPVTDNKPEPVHSISLLIPLGK